MRFLLAFVCLAVIATVVLAEIYPAAEEDQQQLASENVEALLAADSETGHENESGRLARQFGGFGGGYGRGGYGGFGGGRGGYGGGYGRGGYGRGGYGGGGYGGYGGGGRRGGYYG